MIDWIKQNLVLVAGIVLPILLVGGFMVLQSGPSMLADPPQHDFLIVAYRYDAQNPRPYHLSFEVRDGRLQGKATPTRDNNAYPNRQHAGIFRYSAAENAFTEVVYDLPASLDNIEDTVTFAIEEAADLQLDKSGRSPDGYVFEYAGYRGRGGLLGEMFGMGRRYDSYYVLNRNGVYFNLPNPPTSPSYYGHDWHFMGWVIGEEPSS